MILLLVILDSAGYNSKTENYQEKRLEYVSLKFNQVYIRVC